MSVAVFKKMELRGDRGVAVGNKATAADGLGLGLTIARQIIESHKGKINAESLGEGKGTKLTITLPLLDETVSEK